MFVYLFVCLFVFSDISYHMTIKTGDKPNAGTDANVYFALHGDKGETPRIALQDESQTFKRFERGRADKFVVQTADVGKVGLQIRKINFMLLETSN